MKKLFSIKNVDVALAYLGVIVLWGLNYSRLPFGEIAGLDVRPSSVKELDETCRGITALASGLWARVHEYIGGVMVFKTE